MSASSDNELVIAEPASMEPASMEPASKETNVTDRVFHLFERVMDGENRRDEMRTEIIKQMNEQTNTSLALGKFLQNFRNQLRQQDEPAA